MSGDFLNIPWLEDFIIRPDEKPMTRTYAMLEVSAEAYDEIALALKKAHYSVFVERPDGTVVLDMHGIALSRGKARTVEAGAIMDAEYPLFPPVEDK